jgi:hypothetical protein
VRQSTRPPRRDPFERHVLARTLREHRDWTLEELFAYIDSGRDLAVALGELTVAELRVEPKTPRLADAIDCACSSISTIRSRTINPARRRRAQRLGGAQFDELVLEVLCEAQGDVGASYLRARVGGPRWKLQDSLGRLIAAGNAVKLGNTSATRYRGVRAQA